MIERKEMMFSLNFYWIFQSVLICLWISRVVYVVYYLIEYAYNSRQKVLKKIDFVKVFLQTSASLRLCTIAPFRYRRLFDRCVYI
jgi:hypothetical protein